MKRHRLLASSAALVLAAAAHPAMAEDQKPADTQAGVPEIVVTADKVEKPIQKTSMSVTVVNGAEIQREGRSKLDDVLANTPGAVVQGAARGFLVSIRGLGLNLPPQNGAGAVSNNYDGAYSSRAESASAGFYDLDRIEVLRGPQSTLYGRNAVGGVLNVISRDPELGKLGGYVQGEVGDYSNVRGEGAINLPLGDQVALRVAAAGVSRDGYISNGRDDNKASAFRAKLLFAPTDGVSLLLGFEHTTLGGKGPGTVPIASFLAESRVTTDPSAGFQHSTNNKVWAVLKADVGPGQLFIEPSYQNTKGIVVGSFGGNFANNYDPLYTKQFAVEVRYGSKPGSPVQWNVGFYHYNNRGAMLTIAGSCFDGVNLYQPAAGFSNNDPSPGPPGRCVAAAYAVHYGPDIRTLSSDAGFGQVTVPVARGLRIIAGGRVTAEKFGGSTDRNDNTTTLASNIWVFPSAKDTHFDYRAGFEFDAAAHSMLYGTVASGYRQGGYGFATSAGVPYNPEKMKSFELGLKNRLFDGKMLFNIDAFYYDYSAYQLVLAAPCSQGFCVDIKTPPAREWGVEAEAALALTAHDKFTASMVYLDSKIQGTSSYAGMPFPNTPHWQFKAGYSHSFDLGGLGTLTPRADFRALSSQLVFAREQPAFLPPGALEESTQKSYATGDLFLGWTSANDRISVTAYVKNVNDKFVKQSDFFGYVQLQAPRTYGVTAGVKF
ncbi:MAG: TonB-dependent receptor [Proteobacteria bacterium]|nr:TonB-dependent receptor [Pseudomonadota bacterium]